MCRIKLILKADSIEGIGEKAAMSVTTLEEVWNYWVFVMRQEKKKKKVFKAKA